MNAHAPGPLSRIVVGFDDSLAAERALRLGLAYAEQFGGEVIAVNVSADSTPAIIPIATQARMRAFDRGPALRSMSGAHQTLYGSLERIVAQSSVPVWMELETNGFAAGIINAAARWEATAIAMGTHGRTGVSHLLLGSVAEEVVRNATLPVIVTHALETRTRLERLLVGIDGSEGAAAAAEFAAELAIERRLAVICCLVDSSSTAPLRADARATLRAAVERFARAGIEAASEVLEETNVAAGLTAAAERAFADAVVIGARRHSRFGLVSSTADTLIRHATRPVIVVPIAETSGDRASSAHDARAHCIGAR